MTTETFETLINRANAAEANGRRELTTTRIETERALRGLRAELGQIIADARADLASLERGNFPQVSGNLAATVTKAAMRRTALEIHATHLAAALEAGQ